MAIDYKIQRNKLYTTLLSTKTDKGKFFLQKKWTFQNFYDRFFNTDQGVKDLFQALTTQKKENGEFFLNPEKYTLANFYYSFGCDLTFAPEEYCKAKQSKYSGEYVDRKAKLSITDVAGNLTYVLTMEKPYVIPVINKTIDPKISGKLTSKVGDVYVDKKSWGEVKFNFIDDGAGNIELIEVEIIAQGAGFTKKISSYKFRKTSATSTEEPDTQEPESEDGITWESVTKATWEALKKAGYWVKEEGGKLLAAIRNGLHVKKEEVNPFECIDNWNKRWGYYKLLRGDDGKNEFAFEVTDYQVDGKATKFIYYPDYRFVVKFDKTDKDVQGGKGRWACSKDGQGYQLVWDDGRKATFSRLKGQPDGEFSTAEGGQTSQENEVTKLPTFSESCKVIKSCPSVQDVLEKGRAFKLCMKCPEIERLQKIPSLNFLYSQILAENGKKIKTDQYFGPILQAAVKRYQIGLFGKSTGMIGPKTYQSLMKDETSVEDKKVETSQVKIDEPKAEETNLEIVTSQTQL